MKKISILALTLLMFTPFVFSQKKYSSLLWEISGNGLKESSYLYGTMHVSEKIAFNLSDIFFEKLYSSKQVALESDPSLWLDQIKDEIQKYSSGYNYYSYNYDNYKTNYVPLYIKPVETKNYVEALRINNYLADAVLYRRYKENQNFQENTYLDMFIYKAAKKLDKKFYGLEDINVSNKIAKKAIDNYEYNSYNKKSWLKNLLKGRSERIALEDAYRNQDLDLVDSLYKGLYSYNYRKYILYLRNDNMVNAMDSLMKKGSLFSAVGAAHLAGKKGIIEILRAKGYIVKPLNSAYTDKGKKQKENIDQIIYKHPLVMQNAFDGFLIKSPTNFINLTQKQSSYLVSLDIPNGAFLSLSKYKTFEFLNKNDYSTTIHSLDSLLYENIPGKILSKKYITKNNYPGIEITSRNDSDEYLNTQLYITPLEVYIFNLNGSKKYIEQYKNNIFSSLNLSVITRGFSSYTSTVGGYKAILPDFRIGSDSITDSNVTAYNVAHNSYYFINSKIIDMISPEKEEYELKRIPLEFAQNLNIKSIDTKIIKDTIPYSESMVLLNETKKLYLKTFINGPSYNLAGIVTNNEKEKTDFFNSFKPDNFKSIKKTNKFENKYYSINIPFKIKKEDSLLDEDSVTAIDSTHADIFETEECFTCDYSSSFDLENGQKITISFYNTYASDFQKEDDEIIIADFIESHYPADSCQFQKMQLVKKGISNLQYPFWDYALADSISAQAYKIRFYHQNDKIYEIKYIINKHKEYKNPSAEEIYNNIIFIKPKDKSAENEETNIDEEIAEKEETWEEDNEDIKYSEDVEDVDEYSIDKDSTIWIASDKKNQPFYNQMRSASTDPKKIESLLLNSKSEILNTEILNTAITVLNSYEENKTEFYENLLPKFKNNGTAELIILEKIITEDDSKKSLKRVAKLLKKYAPIPSSEYSIEPLLYSFASKEGYEDILFPEILNLLSIPEYKNPILAQLSNLEEENLLKSRHIKKINNYLYEKGENEFKRIFTKLENLDSFDYDNYADSDAFYDDIKTYLNLLSVLNNTNYSRLISQIRETQNADFISLLSNLKKPISLTQSEYKLLTKNILPSKKLNDEYKAKFGRDIFDPEKDLNAKYAEKILLNTKTDYTYSYQKIDSLNFKEAIDLNFENNRYKIFFFEVIKTIDNSEEDPYEDTTSYEEENNEDDKKTQIAVIAFDLTQNGKDKCTEAISYDFDENSSLIPIAYTSVNLNYYTESEWSELRENFTDFIKNKNHPRANTLFEEDNSYEYY